MKESEIRELVGKISREVSCDAADRISKACDEHFEDSNDWTFAHGAICLTIGVPFCASGIHASEFYDGDSSDLSKARKLKFLASDVSDLIDKMREEVDALEG